MRQFNITVYRRDRSGSDVGVWESVGMIEAESQADAYLRSARKYETPDVEATEVLPATRYSPPLN